MSDVQHILVFTTVGSLDEAKQIASVLLERQLAACVQWESIHSAFFWEGKLCESPEWRLTIKTLAVRYEAVELAIKALHSYQMPVIHGVLLDRVEASCADWIKQNSDGPDRR